MRRQSLRQKAKCYLASNNHGSHRRQQQRRQIIRRFIDALFILRCLPRDMSHFSQSDMKSLIAYWRKKQVSDSTIIKYMTDIRPFLRYLGISTEEMGNKLLGLTASNYQPRLSKVNDLISLDQLPSPVRLMLTLQMYLGLTLKEALLMSPEYHVKDDGLWLTREITHNSVDRWVPLRTDEQSKTITIMNDQTNHKPLISVFSETYLHLLYRESLTKQKLNTRKQYRYIYACWLSQLLSDSMTSYKLKLTIMDEMGIKSRTSLWHYLKAKNTVMNEQE